MFWGCLTDFVFDLVAGKPTFFKQNFQARGWPRGIGFPASKLVSKAGKLADAIGLPY
jgi:hypothetical protein